MNEPVYVSAFVGLIVLVSQIMTDYVLRALTDLSIPFEAVILSTLMCTGVLFVLLSIGNYADSEDALTADDLE